MANTDPKARCAHCGNRRIQSGTSGGRGRGVSTELETEDGKPQFIIPDDVSGKVSQVTDGILSASQGGSY